MNANPGDLVVAVDCTCGWHHKYNYRRPSEPLVVGRTYRVVGIRPGPFELCRAPYAYYLEGVIAPSGKCACRFRKIRPDEQEDCEPEFVELLKRSKVSVPLGDGREGVWL